MKLCYPVGTPDCDIPLMAFSGAKRFEENVKTIAEIGYQGVELLVRDGKGTDPKYVRAVLEKYGLEAAAVGSSPIFFQDRLTLANKDIEKRKMALERAKAGIDFASYFQVPYCIGKFRGDVDESSEDNRMEDLTEVLKFLAGYGEEKGVKILLEPQSPPGINNLHTVKETLEKEEEIEKGAGKDNMGLLLDTYHMDLAESSIWAAMVQAGKKTGFVHASDVNRLPVGAGRISVRDTLEMLKAIKYDGYVSVEVAQKPDSYTAAKISYNMLEYWLNQQGESR